MQWQRDLKDPTEFLESVKTDLFQEEVFVFTPRGDLKSLPKGSTPIDFAYGIHSKVGDHCSGARINGSLVPLRYTLRNGDTVDILISDTQRPSKTWLKFVVSSRAKTGIRNYLRSEQRERSKKMGRDLLARELGRRDLSLDKAEQSGLLGRVAQELRLGGADDLLVAVGYGKVTAAQAAQAIAPASASVPDANAETIVAAKSGKKHMGGLRVAGAADRTVRFSKCCNPIPGDSIVGSVSRALGVTVHARECAKALDMDPARRVDVFWEEGALSARPVAVEVVSVDRPGILAAQSRGFTEQGVNIVQAKCTTTEDGRGVNTFHLMVGHVDQLRQVMQSIQKIDGVISVSRI
jgi:GTP pyrophosphokinase